MMFDFESAEIGRVERLLFKVAEIVCCVLFTGLMILTVIGFSKLLFWFLF